MSKWSIIATVLGFSLVAFLGFLWQLSNIRGVRRRGLHRVSAEDKAKAKRKTDRKLSRQEKRIFKQANKLLAKRQILPAAQLLESIGFEREAIQALEDHGLVHDAARILLRMGKPHRAGVIFARHGVWDKAAQCFKMANLPFEAAKSAYEAQDFTMAMEFFEKSGNLPEAADAAAKAGNLHKAALILGQLGERDKAMAVYQQMASNGVNVAELNLEDQEIKMIMEHVVAGNSDARLNDILVSQNKVAEVVLHLLRKGLTKQATELYLRSTTDVGPQLMTDVSLSDGSAESLAELFIRTSAHPYAGMLYERIGSYEKAADAFAKAEEYERASFCYERAGNETRAGDMRRLAKPRVGTPRAGSKPLGFNEPAFSLSEESTVAVEKIQDRSASAPVPDVAPMAALLPPIPQSLGPAAESAPILAPVAAAEPFSVSVDLPTDSLPEQETDQEMTKIDESRSVFHRTPFLADLDYAQRNEFWDIGETLTYSKGDIVLDFDSDPRGVYIVLSGQVACYRMTEGKERFVDEMEPPQSFGEFWLLTDQPTAVKFVALKTTRLHLIEREVFNALMDHDGTIARKIYKRFTSRLLNRLLAPPTSPTATDKAS